MHHYNPIRHRKSIQVECIDLYDIDIVLGDTPKSDNYSSIRHKLWLIARMYHSENDTGVYRLMVPVEY